MHHARFKISDLESDARLKTLLRNQSITYERFCAKLRKICNSQDTFFKTRCLLKWILKDYGLQSQFAAFNFKMHRSLHLSQLLKRLEESL